MLIRCLVKIILQNLVTSLASLEVVLSSHTRRDTLQLCKEKLFGLRYRGLCHMVFESLRLAITNCFPTRRRSSFEKQWEIYACKSLSCSCHVWEIKLY